MAVAFNSEPVKPVHDKDRESVQSCTVSFGGGGGGGGWAWILSCTPLPECLDETLSQELVSII